MKKLILLFAVFFISIGIYAQDTDTKKLTFLVQPTVSADSADDFLLVDTGTGETLKLDIAGVAARVNAINGGNLTEEEIQDIVGAMVTGNSETNISVTYNDGTGKLDFFVTGSVTSVNSQSGAVFLDADDIDDSSTTHKFVSTTDLTAIGLNSAKVSYPPADAAKVTNIPADQNSINSNIEARTALNDAKVTNTDDQDADEVSVDATPANYVANTADVEAHLEGIDTAIGSLSGGGGGSDVTKVGTPANEQLGVWTGDGTIRGYTNLLYNGSNLVLPSFTIGSGGVTTDFNGNQFSFNNTATSSFITQEGGQSLILQTLNGGVTNTDRIIIPGGVATADIVIANSNLDITGGNVDITTGSITATNIDQDVSSGAAPVLDATNMINLPGGGDALTANGLDQFASTTSAELAGVLSNETGTGLVVLNNSPTFTGIPIIPNSFTIGGNSFTRTGSHNLTITTIGTSNVTFPTTGSLVSTTSTSVLTNKTLTSPVINTQISGSVTNGGNITAANYLIGATATQALSNKTLNLSTNNLIGTKAQFDGDLSDGDFMYVGDAPTAHTHVAANITDLTATEVPFTPNGSISSTTVQAAIQEVRDEATTGGVTVHPESDEAVIRAAIFDDQASLDAATLNPGDLAVCKVCAIAYTDTDTTWDMQAHFVIHHDDSSNDAGTYTFQNLSEGSKIRVKVNRASAPSYSGATPVQYPDTYSYGVWPANEDVVMVLQYEFTTLYYSFKKLP